MCVLLAQVVTGLFRRGQHSSIMNRALPLNELSQAYLENDLHRIIDLANKQSRSVRSSQDNGNAKSRRSLVPRLYMQTEREAVDSPTLPALIEPRQLSPLCYYRETRPQRWFVDVASNLLLAPGTPPSDSRKRGDLATANCDRAKIYKTCSFSSGYIGYSLRLKSHLVVESVFTPSSTRMVHGPYAPVSGGPPNKSTLVPSTSSSSDEDDSHILGYRAFSAACERSVSVVSKRLGELCRHNHLQGVRRKLQDTFVKSHNKDPPVSYLCFSHNKDPPVSYLCFSNKDPPVSYLCFSHKDPPISFYLCFSHKDPPAFYLCFSHKDPPASYLCFSHKDPPVSYLCFSHKDPPVSYLCFSHSKDPPVSYLCFSHKAPPISFYLCFSHKAPPISFYLCFSHSKDPPVSYLCFSHNKDPPVSFYSFSYLVFSHSKDPPVSYLCFSHNKDPPVSYLCFSHSKNPPVSYLVFSHSKDPPISFYLCFSHNKDPPVSYLCFSHNKDPPVSSQKCNHTNPQQTTATQTKPSECHKSTSSSSQETLPEHLPLSETILDPLEYLKKAFGDAPMNFNCSRTVKKNRSKEATVSMYESDMSPLLDTHVYPSTSWEHGSLQPRDRDWYSPDPRELFQRESKMYQEPEERRISCASYPYQGSSVEDYEDEAQLHFPASSATEISPETRFASLVSSPPIVYWKRSMF
uniref:Uncharacterized protein n=1 Tax=Timema tahoe TaxID=61484 RepID=A0A7R9IP59_9NEOP|nr:unnamed protein product [Timema tahoe]